MSPQDAPLAEAADRVLPRLARPGDSEAQRQTWALPLADDVVARLVIAGPQAPTDVPASLVVSSGEDGATWLQRAVANLRARTPADYLRPLELDAAILCGPLDDAFAAARALLLGELVSGADHGCLCAVPACDVLLAMPVSRQSFVKVHLLKRLAEQVFKDRPEPISDQVYWVRGWDWQPVHVLIKDDGTISVSPPQELGEILLHLSLTADTEAEE
jgi:hypothetical protein